VLVNDNVQTHQKMSQYTNALKISPCYVYTSREHPIQEWMYSSSFSQNFTKSGSYNIYFVPQERFSLRCTTFSCPTKTNNITVCIISYLCMYTTKSTLVAVAILLQESFTQKIHKTWYTGWQVLSGYSEAKHCTYKTWNWFCLPE
jgi:hypothetical protein